MQLSASSFVSLSVCLSVCLSLCLSVCPCIRLSVSLSVCLSVCLSVGLPACLSVCLSVSIFFRMQQLGSQWKDFRDILYLSIFPNSVEKIQVSLKSGINNEYFTRRRMYCTFMIVFRWVLLRRWNISDKICRENQDTFYVQKFLAENCDVHKIMWKNMVEIVRLQMIIRRKRFTCRTPKATNTNSEYVTLGVLLFQCNNGCTNMPQCYVIRTLVLFLFIFFLTFCWPCISVYLSQYLTNLMHKICFTISFI